MRYSIESLRDAMAAEVIGLDLSLPLGGETVAQLQQGFQEHLLHRRTDDSQLGHPPAP